MFRWITHALRAEQARLIRKMQQQMPLPRNGRIGTPNPFLVHTKQPGKWYSQGGVIVGPIERTDPFELMRRVTTSVPDYQETHVNDCGEVVGMNWIMPDWEHFERMLDGA